MAHVSQMSANLLNPDGPEINRRAFLRGALSASAYLIAARATPPRALGGVDGGRRLAPVKVSRERIIREVVGLRGASDELPNFLGHSSDETSEGLGGAVL